MSEGTTRESEQVMKRACGDCPAASLPSSVPWEWAKVRA